MLHPCGIQKKKVPTAMCSFCFPQHFRTFCPGPLWSFCFCWCSSGFLRFARAVGVYFEVTSKQLCGGTGFWVSGFSNSEAVWLWFRVTVANDLAHRELMSDEAD